MGRKDITMCNSNIALPAGSSGGLFLSPAPSFQRTHRCPTHQCVGLAWWETRSDHDLGREPRSGAE